MRHLPSLVPLLLVFVACGDGALPGPSPGADAGLDAAAAADLRPPEADVGDRLRALPGVTVDEQPSPAPGYRFFILGFDQPVDHDHPDGARFRQRATLLHRSTSAPMVLFSSGYFLSTSGRRTELTALLDANQLFVEHRFFVPSRPDPADWSKLDIRQAAADHHAIVVALRAIYGARWLSTGGSKGGMTSIFHRRFYPGDVDGTVAYSAPLSTGAPDARYVPFVDGDGPEPACRQKLRDFQRAVLSRRAAMTSRMQALAGAHFLRLGVDEALEHAVLETPFAFWQYLDATHCSKVPSPAAPDAALFKFLDQVADVKGYSDEDITAYEPYYYQAATQFGYPAIGEAAVADLLLHPGTDVPRSYAPVGVPTPFDPAAMADVAAWVQSSGERLFFLYGQYDPWAAGQFQLGGAKDSFLLVVPDGNHDSQLADLPDAERAQAVATVRRWAGLDTPSGGTPPPGSAPAWVPSPPSPSEPLLRPSEGEPRARRRAR